MDGIKLRCIENKDYDSHGIYNGYFLLTIGKLYECEWSNYHFKYRVINDDNFSFFYPRQLFCTEQEYRKRKLEKLGEISGSRL